MPWSLRIFYRSDRPRSAAAVQRDCGEDSIVKEEVNSRVNLFRDRVHSGEPSCDIQVYLVHGFSPCLVCHQFAKIGCA